MVPCYCIQIELHKKCGMLHVRNKLDGKSWHLSKPIKVYKSGAIAIGHIYYCSSLIVVIAFQVGTPICVYVGGTVHGLGRISSMQTSNGNQIDSAKRGVVVSVKV